MSTLEYKISVMKAALEGKKIEWIRVDLPGDTWGPFSNTEESPWDWHLCDYRIAPEPRKPREWYAYYDDSPMIHGMRLSPTPVMDTSSGKYIRVREVIEE